MSFVHQYLELTRLQLLSMRADVFIISLINVAFVAGFIFGFGYLFGEVSSETGAFLTTGVATNAIIVVGMTMLPQFLAEAKQQGRLDYFRSLPISREAYLLALLSVVLVLALPGILLGLVAGWLRYDVNFEISAAIVIVVPLATLSLGGFGAAIAIISPRLQLTNAISQLAIFYFIFFAPVLLPRENLPPALQRTSDFLPPTYAADAVRATLTDLSGTHLERSLAVMALFAAFSMVVASVAIRRKG